MLSQLALVVFLAAIVVFFSQDLIKWSKKLFALKGAKLFIPLLIVSLFIYSFEDACLWLLYFYRDFLTTITSALTQLIPFKEVAYSLCLILIITFISIVPVLVLDLIIRKKNYKPYPYPYFTSTLIWIISILVVLT